MAIKKCVKRQLKHTVKTLGEAKNEKIDRSAMIIFRPQFLLKKECKSAN